MFNNPGTKIKGLAKTLFIVSIVLTILACIGLLAGEIIDEDMIFILPFIILIGIGASYLSCLFLAAFGELVETNTQLLEEAKKRNQMLEADGTFTKN